MQAGRYDCIVGGITITPERQRLLAWSTPYMTATLSLVIDGRRSSDLRSMADFRKASVGVQAATTDYDVAIRMQERGEIGSVKVYPFARIQDAIVDLAAGRLTAVMKVYPVAAWLARHTPGLTIAVQVPDDPQPLGIGFRRENRELLVAVNRALADMTRDGSYARLAQKWEWGAAKTRRPSPVHRRPSACPRLDTASSGSQKAPQRAGPRRSPVGHPAHSSGLLQALAPEAAATAPGLIHSPASSSR